MEIQKLIRQFRELKTFFEFTQHCKLVKYTTEKVNNKEIPAFGGYTNVGGHAVAIEEILIDLQTMDKPAKLTV
jgi:hypothetical protein